MLMDAPSQIVWAQPVPVFPLPNCVLLPGGVLPLHIFEPRYRKMMHDVAQQAPDRQHIAMALLREGYEPLYHTNQAVIHPVVCVGQVLEHEMLPDGRYNLLLVGRARGMIRLEDQSGEYRRASLAPRESVPLAPPQSADTLRHELHELLHEAAKLGTCPVGIVDHLFEAHPSLESLLDVLAFYFIPSDASILKQRVLEDPKVSARADIIRGCLTQHVAQQRRAVRRRPGASDWPPPTPQN
jgi:Lon protease-like protein